MPRTPQCVEHRRDEGLFYRADVPRAAAPGPPAAPAPPRTRGEVESSVALDPCDQKIYRADDRTALTWDTIDAPTIEKSS
jgi:hypothetical protein